MDPDGKIAKLTATIYDAMTLKPTKLEMRLSMSADGEPRHGVVAGRRERQDEREHGAPVQPHKVVKLNKEDCHDAKPI